MTNKTALPPLVHVAVQSSLVKPSFLVLIVLAALILFGVSYIVLHRHPDVWTGVRIEGEQSVKLGTYQSLDECKTKIGKVGGSCGRNCRDYGEGLIADCDPLVTVQKEEPHK